MNRNGAVQGLKYPTRYDRQAYHANYGIVNWFTKIGITDQRQQSELMEKFLTSNNFVPKTDGNKDIGRVKASFISNRFSDFTKFVLDNKPAPVAQTW